MAPKKSNVESMIDQADSETYAAERGEKPEGDTSEEQEFHPTWKKYADAKIPISKAHGTLWKSRKETSEARMKDRGTWDAWDEAVRYYKNDQTGKKNRDDPDRPSTGSAKTIAGGAFSQTENLVFSNVSALVPSIYAKNPDCSVQSPKGDTDLEFTTCAQKLLRTLMQKRTAPGINLKPKMRKGVVTTTLTNISYFEYGYIKKEDAVEQTMTELEDISAKLENAKTPKEIEEVEGQLAALDEKVSLLQPSGPFVKYLNPKDIIIDPDAQLADCSDAKWIMIKDVYETSYLNAVYREKDPETGQWKSIYAPTHVLKAASGRTNMAGHDEDITNFNLLKADSDDPESYGFSKNDTASYKRAQRTYVWKIWDRTTRRLIMYADNDWCYPIWVWDDPYGLDDFFPIAPLAFHTDPEEIHARGEVSYYLDQQDQINVINSQVARMRHRVANLLVYDKRGVQDENDLVSLTEDVDGKKLIGIQVPEGKKIEDMLAAAPLPSTEFASLFDKRTLLEAIDRVSGVSSVLKGVEYKTNTTNKAIDSYESTTSLRIDEKIDAIEECIGRIGYGILFLCLRFMPKEDVVKLIGAENANAWPGGAMDAQAAKDAFTLTVVGGSSLKPTSKVRKEQAKEVGQTIGQFGQANPVAFYVVLKMMHRAYSDEMVLEKADWDLLMTSTEQMIQAQQQPPPAAPGGAQGGQAAQQPQQQIDPKAIIQRISQAIEKMPDQLRNKVGTDLAKGVPLEEILGKLQTVIQQSANPQPQTP